MSTKLTLHASIGRMRMIRDKAGARGKIAWRVFEHTPLGLLALKNNKNNYVNGFISKEVHDRIRQEILEDSRFSKIKQHGESCTHKQLVSRGLFNQLRWMLGFNHNIVTNQGDALIADNMSETPAQTKVDNTNGHITVGTGWTGTTPKTNEAVNTPTDSPEVMDATYPKQKGAFGAANDNITQYRATFEAGDLNASGIDEAGLGNHATEASGDNLAYGEISPAVNVTTADTLQVDWEITYTGA